MKENVKKAWVISLAMLALVLMTWLVDRTQAEEEEESIDQVYLNQYLKTDETIPTLDELVEDLGQDPSVEAVEAEFGGKTAALFDQDLLPFEAALPKLDQGEDLQAIERYYYDQVVTGISPVRPSYTIEEGFQLAHHKPHVSLENEALFVDQTGFKRVSDWLKAGYFQVYPKGQGILVVEGLVQVTEDKNLADVINLVNSLQVDLAGQEVKSFPSLLEEEDLQVEDWSNLDQADNFRYQEAGLSSQDYLQAQEEFTFLEPDLYGYLDSPTSKQDLKVMDNTILTFKGFLADVDMDSLEESHLSMNKASWGLEETEERTIEVNG
ncbi:Uncharacterised protein [Alloiococcus otitis]|uniref:Uncharacterized protein n=1 Tax=Alloiococcus otitis ATCC 51267 TaxID=883081 RepID=K9EQI7_9LACT|nr:hypothetical protein [Alloiococcus otitis]EKU93212.1 hypothetical protein HMPREF9698_01373 [Alloiococcus otitis ATCC 51267]SUU80550.1 Uncharacterised protein [Alloiococcus otitis]